MQVPPGIFSEATVSVDESIDRGAWIEDEIPFGVWSAIFGPEFNREELMQSRFELFDNLS